MVVASQNSLRNQSHSNVALILKADSTTPTRIEVFTSSALLSKLCSRSLHLYLFSYLHFPHTKDLLTALHRPKIVFFCLFKSSSHLYIIWILGPPARVSTCFSLGPLPVLRLETPRSWRRTAITSVSSPTFQRSVGLVGTFQHFEESLEGYLRYVMLRMEDLWKYGKIWHRYGMGIYGNLWQSMAIYGEWNLFRKFQLMVWHGQRGTGFGGEWGWQGTFDTCCCRSMKGLEFELRLFTGYWDIQILRFS